MLVEHDLLETLCCPVSKWPLRVMTPQEVQEVNTAIVGDRTSYADGVRVTEPMEGALATIDEASVYAIREGVPALLPELRIVRGGNAAPVTGAIPGTPREGPAADYWAELSRHWDDRQPPRRPGPQDTALLERVVGEALASARPARPRALQLGVTPEIATMRWPSGTHLLALDLSVPMIRNVWPAQRVHDAAVVRGDWLAMPVRDATYDIVVGDASISIQRYPDAFFSLVREVRRVLKDNGVLATRVFSRPEEREPLDKIFADLRAGGIGNLDFLRWRLVAALHRDRAAGTRMGDIWDAWEANVPDPHGLMESLGWPLEAPRAMEHLRGGEAVAIFPTLRELRDDLRQDFEEAACDCPDCEDGDRYPTMVFRPRPRPSHHRSA